MSERIKTSRRAFLGQAAAVAGFSTVYPKFNQSARLQVDLRAPASELLEALRQRKASATELCRAAISRIEAHDGKVNAVVVRDFDRALADAREADEAIARGDNRPLLGLPVTVKECFDLRGHPTTYGLEEHRGHRAASDAEVVKRMRRAGAIILGKTNVPAGLADFQCSNPLYGRTSNPYKLSRSPGGSSGGAAAAIAMAFSALEVGTDLGGSIRVPAAFCGVYGLKTSYGAVSMKGVAPGGAIRAPREMVAAGPMARSAADLALLLQVITGPDSESPATSLTLPPRRHKRLSDYRVFVLTEFLDVALDDEVKNALNDAVRNVRRAGARVERSSDKLPDLSAVMQITRQIGRARRAPQPPTIAEWFKALDDQQEMRMRWSKFFEEFDVVLMPAFGTTAFPFFEDPDWSKRTLTINGRETPYNDQQRWSVIASLAHLPAAVAPIGLDRAGLPIGAQVIAPFLADLTAIHFAGLIGQSTPAPALPA